MTYTHKLHAIELQTHTLHTHHQLKRTGFSNFLNRIPDILAHPYMYVLYKIQLQTYVFR